MLSILETTIQKIEIVVVSIRTVRYSTAVQRWRKK